MQTFETYRQYLGACTERTANSHKPPAAPYFWTCETCGKCAPHGEGYGIDPTTQSMHCYRCCHARDLAEMLDRSRPFVAYVSGDKNTVRNWPGGELGRIHSYAESRTGWHGSVIVRFHVRDAHGQWWQGRGPGAGMACTLRPMAAPAYAKQWGKGKTKGITYLYRSGDGNEGNYPRHLVTLAPNECPFSALRALVVNGYIPGSRTRRHIMRSIGVDGEPAYGVYACVHEGPNEETAYGAAWLTAELEPLSAADLAHYQRQGMQHYERLRDALDRGAWAYFRKG